MLSLGAAIGLMPDTWEGGPWPNVLVGALVIYLLGFTDDIGGLGPVSKLVVQFMAAFVAAASGLCLDAIELPWFGAVPLGEWAIPVTMFWIVGVTNAFNLIDGLDGLAGGLAYIAALALFALNAADPGVSLVAVILAGALAGFLRYNFNPARVFMGDSGSLFVGYLLACLAVKASAGENAVTFAVPLLVLAVPLLDTATAMGRRYLGAIWAQGSLHLEAALHPGIMFQPDRQHIHHRLLDRGLSQRQAVSLLYVLGAAFAVMGVLASTAKVDVAWVGVLTGAILFFIVRLFIAKAAN
jgi:UDP-GlcNAc:undecaprenyl-phosphate GlcNAc-1-phosphate transferase